MSPAIAIPLMFATLLVCLALGLPLAFTMGGIAVIFTALLWGTGGLAGLVSASLGVMGNFVLVAIPLFILMSMILDKAKIATDLFNAAYKWSGPLRGSLAAVTILVCTIVAATTGIAATGVIAMGLIAFPRMMQYKYKKEISLGSILAGGSLGELIPPSTVIILYGATVGVSVGRMFAGGICAGVIFSGLFIAYVLTRAFFQKDLCPALPAEDRASWRDKMLSLRTIILPVFVIVVVLGSIITGAATPTEAAAVGVAGAIISAAALRRLNWSMIKASCIETIKLSGMVGWIVVSAACFSSTVLALGAARMMGDILMAMPGGALASMALTLGIVFLLGMFVSPTAIIFICGPLFAPAMQQLGIDSLWYSILFVSMLQVAYISPPFGYSLFYLSGVTPADITIRDVYKSAWPFIVLQVVALIIFVVSPEVVLWLPHLMG